MLAQIYWDTCTRYFYSEILIQFAWNALGSNTHMALLPVLCSNGTLHRELSWTPYLKQIQHSPFSATVFNEPHWSTRTLSRPGKQFDLVLHACVNVHNRKLLGASLPRDSQEMFPGAVFETQMDKFADRFNFLMF